MILMNHLHGQAALVAAGDTEKGSVSPSHTTIILTMKNLLTFQGNTLKNRRERLISPGFITLELESMTWTILVPLHHHHLRTVMLVKYHHFHNPLLNWGFASPSHTTTNLGMKINLMKSPKTQKLHLCLKQRCQPLRFIRNYYYFCPFSDKLRLLRILRPFYSLLQEFYVHIKFCVWKICLS